MARFALLMLLCAVLSGCGRYLEEGVVVGKRHEPARTYVRLMPVMSYSNGSTRTILIPYTMYDDEDFFLSVSGRDEDGNMRVEDWKVPESVFDSSQVGDAVVYQETQARREDTHVKKGRAE